MPLEIVSYRFKRQNHQHKCPICKLTQMEPNDVCAKITGDHIFPCLVCLADYRRRFSDDVLDAYLSPAQIDKLHHVTPDEVSDDLDGRDAARREKQLKEVAQKAEVNPETYRPKTVEERQGQAHQHLETYEDVAIKMTEDEVVEEIKKLREDERI